MAIPPIDPEARLIRQEWREEQMRARRAERASEEKRAFTPPPQPESPSPIPVQVVGAPKGNAAAGGVAAQVTDPSSPPATQEVGYGLPIEPPGARYEADLEAVCRSAALIGSGQETPINYARLLLALYLADDANSQYPVLPWFREFLRQTGVNTAAMFAAAGADEARSAEYRDMALSAELPERTPLYSYSARRLFAQAWDIARLTAADPDDPPEAIGVRHLMAAFALRSPAEHLEQVRRWGVDPDAWAEGFRKLAQGYRGDEDWGQLEGVDRSPTQLIGTFTSDDPLAPSRDVLGVDDEAAAFARIVAARAVKPPLAIGIFGEWGSGKTFFMRRIHDNVARLSADAARREKEAGDAGPFLPEIVQIRFNAWHYIETNLWASLVEYVFAELDQWLQQQTAASSKSDAEQVFNRLATARQLKIDALEDVVTRRAERHAAEQRADDARREYEQALVRASGVGAGTYARALMDTILKEDPGLLKQAAEIGEAVGAPHLAESTGRLIEVLENARSESGRALLTGRALAARLGTAWGIVTIFVVLVAVPYVVVGLRDFLYGLSQWPWLTKVHDVALAVSGIITGIAATGGLLLRQARTAIGKLDDFDKTLAVRVKAQVDAAGGGGEAAMKKAAEEDLSKRRQALEAAERALADAESRLNTARGDFEATTARSRLNAFIRAKAADGDYAKHLGIIAAIRRDFGQLASLIGGANDAESLGMAKSEDQGEAAVAQFLDRLGKEPESRLTVGELRSLLTLLDPVAAGRLIAARRSALAKIVDNEEVLRDIGRELEAQQGVDPPKLSRIVLYIDDLDRCSTEVVVKVLEAVHLLLCFPLFTVVVAVDARWVSRALHERFPKLLERGVFAGQGDGSEDREGATSLDYLEKIFQLPYWVRPVDHAGATRYVGSLVEDDVRRARAAEQPPPPVKAIAMPAAEQGAPAAAPVPSLVATGAGTDSSKPTPATGFTVPLTSAAVGLEITEPEARALERFAPLISPTPRRLLRFVNLYRLLKTALTKEARERLFGEGDGYRALVAQLAIVTGAPDAAPLYFEKLRLFDGDAELDALRSALSSDRAFETREGCLVRSVIEVAATWEGRRMKVEELKACAQMARRYSFTAWNL